MDNIKVMEFKDYDSLLPQVYGTGDFIDHIFMVPQKNSVGTNDIDNAIMTLGFKQDGEMDKMVVKKDFLEEVTGSYKFSFVSFGAEKYIAYSQSRGFIIVNLQTKHIEIYTVISGLDDNIEKVVLLDPKTFTFLFEILSPYGDEKKQGYEKTLRILRFKNKKMEILAEHPVGFKSSSYTEPWFVYNGLIFIYNDSLARIDAFDSNFKQVIHPLSTAFNEHKHLFRSMREIAINPTANIAIIHEKGKRIDWSKIDTLPENLRSIASDTALAESNRYVLYLFNWANHDPEKRFIPIVSDKPAFSIWDSYKPESYSHFEFSPDGKWLVFRDETIDGNNPCFVAVPIDPQNPLYLGKPIKLGNALRKEALGPVTATWATDPLAFVMTDGLLLYKWDLGHIDKTERVKMPELIIPVPSETGKK